MVLRTLYLPSDTDRQLRSIAFTRSVSKGELMRELITQGLVKITESGERSLADRIEERAVSPDVAKARSAKSRPAVARPQKPTPPVPVGKTITPDYLISLEDGRRYKSLKRHLGGRGLTPDEYRAKWNLNKNYPMVAPNYAKQRSELAKSLGLGRAKKPATPGKPVAAASRSRRPSAAKTA